MEQEQIIPIPEETEVKTHRSGRVFRHVTLYLRELSVVIVGILITLLITGLINDYNRKKELRGMLSLVTEELEENAGMLHAIQHNWEREQYAFSLLQHNISDLDSMPADTLEKYRSAIGNLHYFKFKEDYYDVLKSSVLTQYIKDKAIMARLSATYGTLSNLAEQLERYSVQKSEFYYPMLQNMEPEETYRWMNGTVYDFFIYPLRDKGFKSFLVTGGTIISPGTFEDAYGSIDKTVAYIRNSGF